MKPKIGDAFKTLDIRGQVQKKKVGREEAIVSAIVATMSEIVLFTGKCSDTELSKFFKFDFSLLNNFHYLTLAIKLNV